MAVRLQVDTSPTATAQSRSRDRRPPGPLMDHRSGPAHRFSYSPCRLLEGGGGGCAGGGGGGEYSINYSKGINNAFSLIVSFRAVLI